METRASIPVTLPRPNPSKPYWQDPPDKDVADLRTTDHLPSTAVDVVIIGSGITGCSVAWNLLSSSPDTKIVMLEARQACSGATGRNGGHTKAASYRSFPDHVSTLGLEEAKRIARLELANIRQVHSFARDMGIRCDSEHPRNTVDVIYDAAQWREAQEAVGMMRAAMPGGDDAGVYELHSAEEVGRRFLFEEEGRLKGKGGGGGGEGGEGQEEEEEEEEEKVYGGVSYEAGSLNAYKLAVGILKLCLAKGLDLQTHTPALSIKKEKEEEGEVEDGGKWRVHTDRGDILTKRVVLASNGYTAALLPEVFQGVIVPLRGHVTAQRAGMGIPTKTQEGGGGGGIKEQTYSFIYKGGYEYMVPRRRPGHEGDGDGDGDDGGGDNTDIVIGGGLTKTSHDEGMGEYGTTDDVGHDEGILAYLRECLPGRFFGGKRWGGDDPRGRIKREWTGIMGYSPDGMPFVGQVPGQKDLWVCASFQGHGMVLCWMCAKALGIMMTTKTKTTTTGRDGEEKEEEEEEEEEKGIQDWFPEAFRISGQRLGNKFQGRLHTTTAAAAAAAAAAEQPAR